MGRAPCCDKATVKKGPWSPEEDSKLKAYIDQNGTGGNWIALPQKVGLKRCGKSCRLRWLNYLRPNIKHGEFSEEEDDIICSLYNSIGSRWSVIAAQLPGRTDNDIKNYWNTKLKKKLLGKRKDQHKRHLAAAAEARQKEVNDLRRYVLSETNIEPYGYETQTTAQVDEHTNIKMNCPYVDFDPEIVSQLFEQANCSRAYTISDTRPISQSATFQLNLQQAFDDQMSQFDKDTSVRMLIDRLEATLIGMSNNMNMSSTSQMEASNCISNSNSSASQTQDSTVGVEAQISYQTAAATAHEYTTWIEDHVKLECPMVLDADLSEIVNLPLFPPISCGSSPDVNYESGCMNTINAQSNMNLHMEADEVSMYWNDLLNCTKTNGFIL
ncbi:hypothetical protein SUGI_0899090 [Cryptomeria japonica]|uniref:transcription factor RAX3 n=1 Tax=Cryptomeria japonica TaxID=3369 RepID=UPI002414CB1D|nr:transcription factor RAX3 [Cryptomeria japonica]GLJ43296.1 hypothetical protein SUGI_0899090 [Cryptomeria japonica]